MSAHHAQRSFNFLRVKASNLAKTTVRGQAEHSGPLVMRSTCFFRVLPWCRVGWGCALQHRNCKNWWTKNGHVGVPAHCSLFGSKWNTHFHFLGVSPGRWTSLVWHTMIFWFGFICNNKYPHLEENPNYFNCSESFWLQDSVFVKFNHMNPHPWGSLVLKVFLLKGFLCHLNLPFSLLLQTDAQESVCPFLWTAERFPKNWNTTICVERLSFRTKKLLFFLFSLFEKRWKGILTLPSLARLDLIDIFCFREQVPLVSCRFSFHLSQN